MNRHFIAAVFFGSLLNSSCLSTLLGTKENKSKEYHFPKPGTWERVDPAEADAAFRNPKDQALLNVTSVCGEGRYRSLEELTEDILSQLPEHELVGDYEPRRIDGHPALITGAKGSVDGEALETRIAIIRTPDCVYDFILAGKKLDVSSRDVFEQTISGFRAGR